MPLSQSALAASLLVQQALATKADSVAINTEGPVSDALVDSGKLRRSLFWRLKKRAGTAGGWFLQRSRGERYDRQSAVGSVRASQNEATTADLFAASENQHRKVVIIGGPGGSGTGPVANGMQLSGVYLGPPDGLGPPDAGHPKGKFQNLKVEKFHNQVLAELGCEKFAHPSAEKLEAYVRSDRYLPELSLILEQFAGSPVFGWKCPVTGGLLPLWKRALVQNGYRLSNVYFINCLRDERCVALSLRKLGVGFETLSEQELLDFIREDLRRTYKNIGQDMHHLIVPFDSLIKNPVDEFARLALILGLPDIPEAQIRELVDAKIPRHSIPESQSGNDVLEIFRQFRKGGVL